MREYFEKVWVIAKVFKRPLLKMFIALAVLSIASVFAPYAFARIIESMTEGLEMLCIVFIVVIGLITILDNLAMYYKSYIEINYYSFDLGELLSIFIINRYSKFSVGQLINRNSAYDQSVVTSGKEALAHIVKLMVFETLPLLLQIVCIIVSLLFIATSLGLVIFFSALLFLFLVVAMDHFLKEGAEVNSTLRHARNKNFTEIIRNMKLITTNNRIDKSLDDYRECNLKFKTHSKKYWTKFINWSTMRDLTLGAILVSIFVIGIFYTDYSISAKITAFILAERVLRGMRRLNDYYKDMLENKVAIKQMFELVETKPDIILKENSLKLDELKGEIEFREVDFAYTERNESIGNSALQEMTSKKTTLLRNTNLKIEAGETVALVGSSGGGKTTMINLLLRFFDPDEGKVLIDGYNLRDIDLGSFREKVGIVPQDIEFFDDSILFNLEFAVQNNGMEVDKALEMSFLSDFCSGLKNGKNTVIGERGITLSGGQKQRLAIARELMKDPSILIFDEATSSLDLEIEAKILKSIKKASIGRTTIIVAHRLSTLKEMKRIIMLSEGKVVGDGNFQELSENCQEFQRLIKYL
jgi:ABC-type multidrug transport system fused ATPase/permease subunit